MVKTLQPYVDNGNLAGAIVLVANKVKELTLETVGFANIAAKKPIRSDTVFWIASITKPITATALMMLVDEGKVSLTDPVEKYLPEFKDQTVGIKQENGDVLLRKPHRPMTIADVLSNTSGLPFLSPLEQPTIDRLSLADIVRVYSLLPLQSDPGTAFEYSNEGFGVAGRMIEVVSGMPYEEFLSKRLFEPLGMIDTTFWPNPEQINRLVSAYRANEKKTGLEETLISYLSYPLDGPNRYPTPGGGIFSTITDSAKFCRMILCGGVFEGKRYLSEAAIRKMSMKHTGEMTVSYGLGWFVNGSSFNHGGAYNTKMWVDPERELAMLLFAQHENFVHPESGKELEEAFQTAAKSLAQF